MTRSSSRGRRPATGAGVLAAAVTAGLLAAGAGAVPADADVFTPAATTSAVEPTTTTGPTPPADESAPPTTTTAPPPTTTTTDSATSKAVREDDSVGDDSGGSGRAAEQQAARAAARREAREKRAAARRRKAAKAKEKAASTKDDAKGDSKDDADASDDSDDVRADEAAAAPDDSAAALLGSSALLTTPGSVPGLFIEKFRIPPFLLPIYQAAGVQYGVRWEVLAAINEIETDYGRNLSVSTAGAVGWMQFMPATWKTYGVDADGDGRADPMSPVDAIFAAARYLRAAGAQDDVRKAVFAYNHADWYVDSVLLRARLIGGLPAPLVSALTGLTQGTLPVAGAVAATDDDARDTPAADAAGDPVWGARPGDDRAAQLTADAGTPVLAVQDGTVVSTGDDKTMGRWIRLRDVYGNVYTYAHLGRVARTYDAPRSLVPARATLPKADPAPTLAASAGDHPAAMADAETTSPLTSTTPSPLVGATTLGGSAAAGSSAAPSRVAPAPGAAAPATAGTAPATGASVTSAPGSSALTTPGLGGLLRLVPFTPAPAAAAPATKTAAAKPVRRSASVTPPGTVRRPLRPGARVNGGTVLGTIGTATKRDPDRRSSMAFGIRPAGPDAPRIDPRPILDGWRLLATTTEKATKTTKAGALFGTTAASSTAGRVLLLSKAALQARVLADDRLDIPDAGRSQIRSGAVDRRVLATLAYLATSGHRIRVSSLGRPGAVTTSGSVSEHASGSAVDIAEVDGQRITPETQGPGTVTDRTIRLLLRLQGPSAPHQIISLMLPSDFGGATNVLALADHADHIHVGFRVVPGGDSVLGRQAASALRPGQWQDLIDRLKTIKNPEVASKASRYSLKVRRSGGR